MRRVNQWNGKKIVRRGLFFLLFAVLVWNVAATGGGAKKEKSFSIKMFLLSHLQQQVLETIMPLGAFQTGEHRGETDDRMGRMVLKQSPYFSYALRHQKKLDIVEDEYFYRLLLEKQQKNEETDVQEKAVDEGLSEEEALLAAMEAENAQAKQERSVSGNAILAEQEEGTEEAESESVEQGEGAQSGEAGEEEEAREAASVSVSGFQRVLEKSQYYDWGLYKDKASLIKDFYAVDSTTSAEGTNINLEQFLERDLSIDKNTEDYQILIFHTHSQETFADSIPGDKSTSIVGIGEYLTRILTEEYGYKVLHHTGEYDVEYRDDAYSKALPAIEQILKDHPSIQVVLDLHRDEVQEGTKLVTEVQGRPTAKLMFFNGISYTNQTGKIGYLENVNQDANLAFSFQMQVACNEYFPGLTRKIYLKGYRYNMHLKERFLLVEMGAQTNTVEEIKNACDPLAQTLDMVLSGMVY